MPTWQICIMVVSAMVGVIGLWLAFWTFCWNKKESRHQALSAILRDFVAAMQQLVEANKARRTAEELRFAFPAAERAPDAVNTAEEKIERYGTLIASASDSYKKAEREIAATGFRFPDRVRHVLRQAILDLAELGNLVNNGRFDAADVQQAKVEDTYKRLMRLARGWRLTSPFEALRKNRLDRKLIKQDQTPKEKYKIEQDRMDVILGLVHKRFTDEVGNSFAVHPPQIMLQDPDVARRDSVVDELEGQRFRVVFQDGTAEFLSFPEFVVFIYNVIFAAVQMRDIAQKLKRGGFGPVDVQVKTQFSIQDLMRSEMVKAILGKVEFSATPCD